MTDTIDPNSQIPEPGSNGDNTNPAPSSSERGFYNGFDRPDSTRINLAGDNPGKIDRLGNEEYDRLANQKLVGSVPPEKDFDSGENLSNLDPKLSEIKVEPKSEPRFNDEPPKDILEESEEHKGTNGVTDPAEVGSQAPHFAPANPPKPETLAIQQKEREPINGKAIASIFFGGIVAAAALGFLSYFISGTYYDKKIDEKNNQLAGIEDQINELNKVPDPLSPTVTTSTTTTTAPSATTSTTKPVVAPSTTTTIRSTTTTTTTTRPITPTTTTPGGLG